jgi:predicted alpha/beta hydrolase family esterase
MSTKNLNCIIIHGCPPNIEGAINPETRTYDKHWIPWLKRNLIEVGIKTETPLMPEPWSPNYEKFKVEFEKYEVDENTVLVGHSCGAAFLVRWLGETKKNFFKLILVAPWRIPNKDDKLKKEFYTYSIDEGIKLRASEIVMFTADNEEDKGKESLKIFHQALGGEVIELKGHGHYTMDDMGTEELPELLEKIVHFDNRKALVVPINSQNKILIQDRRGHRKPDWGYFGGEIELGETSLQALIREIKEELQIIVQPNELKYLGTLITLWNELKIIRYIYLYHTDKRKFNILESKSARWLTFKEARERLDDKDNFSEVSSRINKLENK